VNTYCDLMKAREVWLSAESQIEGRRDEVRTVESNDVWQQASCFIKRREEEVLLRKRMSRVFLEKKIRVTMMRRGRESLLRNSDKVFWSHGEKGKRGWRKGLI
jgi:hypothetical protein